MTLNAKTLAAALALVSGSVLPAYAHAKLGGAEAKIGGSYEASFEIPHGCAGQPTIEVYVQMPPGYLDVVPAEVAGWKSAVKSGSYDRPYTLNGTSVAEGVTEVSWSGGSLADDAAQTFKVTGTFASDLTPGQVFFPMVQVCPDGEQAWIERSEAAGGNPAPSVNLTR